MTDDSPWQDLKDAREGVRKAAKGVDDFATHSTSRVIGPLATKALEASKGAIKRWFEPDHKKPARIQAQPPHTAWSISGALLKLFGHDAAKEGVPVDGPADEAPAELQPEPPAADPEVFDV